MCRFLMLALCLAVPSARLLADERPVITDEQLTFFETKIRPVLSEHCYECHAAGAKIVQGGLRLDHREGLLSGGDTGAAIVPHRPESSLLIQALRYEGLEMPPKGRLPERIVKDFENWIAKGAPDPREATDVRPGPTRDPVAGRGHWAFQPVSDPPVPSVGDSTWPFDSVDRFVLAGLERAGLQPVSDADRYTWLRRVSLDLTGLPPTPEEIRDFVSDTSPLAFDEVVDRLLNSRAYGERWARHWLDLTGYADMIGTSNNVFAEHAWRYRDYLIDSFQKDKPLDRFIREQIAGDLMPASSTEERAENITATGFLMLGDVEIVEPDKPKMEADHVDSQVSRVGTVFLGMTLGCVRCHDHKFDPIELGDYYGMAGMFRSSPSTHKIPFGVWSSLNTTDLPETPQQLADRQQREAAHAERMASMKSEQKKLTEKKQAIVATLAERDRQEAASTVAPVTAEPMADRESLTRERDALTEQLRKLAAEIQHAEFFSSMVPRAFAMRDGEQPADMPILIRGNPYAPGAVVPRGAIRVASWEPFPEIPARQSGRLQLADWIVDPRNPLTARVTVNRLWQKLFGEGLVRSVDYVGTRGETPTHPELLDHLASRLVRNGWSQKQFIRGLVLSRVYRLSSRNDDNAMTSDPDNRLLWRMNRQRLDAEAIRDSLLAVSGELRPAAGGPALVLEFVENTGALVQSGVNPPNYTHRKPRPSQEFERTVYLPVIRTGFVGPDRVRNVFDFVNPAQITGQRSQTVVPTQSLFLMNNELLRKRSQGLAEQLLAMHSDPDTRLEQLWLRALNRPITSAERDESTDFLSHLVPLLADPPQDNASTAAADTNRETPTPDVVAWTELCHALLSSNEFIFRM